MPYLKRLFWCTAVYLFPLATHAQPFPSHAHPAAAAHTRAAASEASANFDATYYALALDLRFGAVAAEGYVYGRTHVAGRAVGEPLQALRLDFSSNMTVDSVRAPGGARLGFSHEDDVLAIPLPQAVPVGEAVAVEVFYQGLPVDEAFGTFRFGRDPYRSNPMAWTLSEPYGAREWWPSKDHPSDKADSVRVTVTVPEALRVGANGLLQRETANGDGTKTYDWFTGYPTASYLVSFAAGVYDVYAQTYARPDSLVAAMGPLSMPVLHYAYSGSNVYRGDSLHFGWQLVTDVLPVFEHWFGPYPFAREKYGHAHVTFGGGMEHQTMSSMGGSGIGLVAHELAHQWYGDLVTLRYWPHLWLNEGFATYGELLYYEARPDRYAADYQTVFDLYYRRARNAGGTLVVQGGDTTSVSTLFSASRVYAKGGMVLHMLRGVVGDAAFRDILRTYAAEYAYGTATTADFQRVAEEVSGEDLDVFFRQWVTHGTGYPIYEVRWGYAPADAGYRVVVTLAQVQEATSNVEVFEMPVTFAVETARGEERFTVRNDRAVQTYTFEVDAPPTAVVFDPDRWILHSTPVTVTDSAEVPALPERVSVVGAYPNPVRDVLHVEVALPQAGPVRLVLYDALGRRVRRLADEAVPAADVHTFTFDVGNLPSGTYFVRLEGSGAVWVVTIVPSGS